MRGPSRACLGGYAAERIEKRKREKDDLQGQLAIEMGKQVTFTAPQIKAFLYSLKRGNVNDENNNVAFNLVERPQPTVNTPHDLRPLPQNVPLSRPAEYHQW